jgi:uncharacterized protein with PIN domain
MKSSEYPAPVIECPHCSTEMRHSHRVRVKYRGPSNNVADTKILERAYRCPKCYHKLWHEIAAKALEGGIL